MRLARAKLWPRLNPGVTSQTHLESQFSRSSQLMDFAEKAATELLFTTAYGLGIYVDVSTK